MAAKMDADDKALPGRVRFWLMRKSIPADHWGLVVRAGLATADEMISAAEAKRIAALPANDTQPQEKAA